MTEPSTESSIDVGRAIADIKRRRILGFTTFAVASLLGIVLALVCDAANRTRLVPVVLVPFLGIGILALIRVFSSRCPACGKLFFGAPIRTLYASSCYHCSCDGDAAQHAGAQDGESAGVANPAGDDHVR